MDALFLVASSRSEGNTEQLARVAAESLPKGASQTWLRLSDYPLGPFVDHRHDGVGYGALEGPAKALAEATLAATDLVFVAPVYWYGLPAIAKLYLDHWSGWLRVPGLDFKKRMAGKGLWVVSCNSDDPESNDDGAQPLLGMMERTARYMDMAFHGALLGHGNRPGDVVEDKAAMAAAARFFGLRTRGH